MEVCSTFSAFKSSGGEENADSQKENKAPNVSRLTSSGEETARRTTLATSQQERFAGDFNSQPKDFHGGDNSERAAKLPSEARQSKTGKAAAKIGEGSSLPTKHNLDDGSNDFSGSQVVDDDVLEGEYSRQFCFFVDIFCITPLIAPLFSIS